jgi:diguanylate cyclase (GGDEF)-like protein
MLDHHTLIIAQIVLGLFYAVILSCVHRIYPNIKGIVYLIWGFLTAPLELALYILPRVPSHPDLFGAFGDTLSLVTVGLFYVGMLRHLASPRSPKLAWIITSMAVLSAAVLSAQGRPFARTVVVCIDFAIIRGAFAVELFRSSSQRKLIRAFAFFMAMYAFVSLNSMFLRSNFVQQGFSQQSISMMGTTFLTINILFSVTMSFFFLFVIGTSIMHNLEIQSRTDSLTGILNRRGIEEKLREECALSAREGRIFSVALIDVDYFKSINDQFGHAVGDSALRGITDTILTMIRKYDYLGRLGGDEFLLVLTSIDGQAGLAIVERLCQFIKTVNLSSDFSLSVSIGITQYESIDSVSTLLARADLALYKAKESGRGCARLETVTLRVSGVKARAAEETGTTPVPGLPTSP